MVVDDAIVARSLVTRWIEASRTWRSPPRCAPDARRVDRIEAADPDVVLLDVEMPELDGISALPLLLRQKARPRRHHGLDAHAAQRRAEPARAGAGRDRLHPQAGDHARGHDFGRVPPRADRQSPRPWAATAWRRANRLRLRHPKQDYRRAVTRRCHARPRPYNAVPMPAEFPCGRSPSTTPRALLIGSSTGGPQALTVLVEKLPAAIDRAPMLITQHMPPTFTAVLAEHLSRAGGRGAHEAEHGEPVLAGGIYVAPGGRHMRVVRERRRRQDRARRRSADQFLQAGGRSLVFFRGGDLGLGLAWRSFSPAWAMTARAAPPTSSPPAAASSRRTRRPALSGVCRDRSRRPVCARPFCRSTRLPPKYLAYFRETGRDAARL